VGIEEALAVQGGSGDSEGTVLKGTVLEGAVFEGTVTH
jgi:hypothetical protein